MKVISDKKIEHLPLVTKLKKGVGYWDEPIYNTVQAKRITNAVRNAFSMPQIKSVSVLDRYEHKKIKWLSS